MSEIVLTCNYMGRLGNVLFQVATTMATAQRLKVGYALNYHPVYSMNILSKISHVEISIDKTYREPSFKYIEIPTFKRSTTLGGYFQSWKYFDEYKQYIVSQLQLESKSVTDIFERFRDRDTVAVHVRRTDYLKFPDIHKNLSLNYYFNAIQKVGKDKLFIIFSDDVEWCQQQELFINLPNVWFVPDSVSEYDSFVLMSMCKSFIISNSSYSWWASYISGSQLVICPSEWFGINGPEYNISDIILPWWQCIDDVAIQQLGLSIIVPQQDHLEFVLYSFLLLHMESEIEVIVTTNDNYILPAHLEEFSHFIKTWYGNNPITRQNVIRWKEGCICNHEVLSELIKNYFQTSKPLRNTLMVNGEYFCGSGDEIDILDPYYEINEINSLPQSTHFHLVVPSYNCSTYLELCLKSIANQTYKNYQVTVIDDASTETKHHIIAKKYCLQNRWMLITNKYRKGALQNIYESLDRYESNDDDVIVTVDGDDMLFSKYSLLMLNYIYQQGHMVTYGSYLHYDKKGTSPYAHNQMGICKQVELNVVDYQLHRQSSWLYTHLRTFKYYLWRHVKKEDLLDKDGKFYDVAWDFAIMYPLVEMAGRRIKCIYFPMYYYNVENPLNDFKLKTEKQVAVGIEILDKSSYQVL